MYWKASKTNTLLDKGGMEGGDFCPKGLIRELDSVPQRLEKSFPPPPPHVLHIHFMAMLILAEK